MDNSLSVSSLLDTLRNVYIADNNLERTSHILSLNASVNIEDPIYFWQLQSVIGKKRIKDIITHFYQNVFDDVKAPWFRDFFVDLGPLEYHVNSQTRFWWDLTGPGNEYTGGMKRLKLKHKLAKEVMTDDGSARWMYHFMKALRQSDLGNQPVRVIVCIIDFINFFMKRYATEFDFNFIDFNKLLGQHDFSKL